MLCVGDEWVGRGVLEPRRRHDGVGNGESIAAAAICHGGHDRAVVLCTQRPGEKEEEEEGEEEMM